MPYVLTNLIDGEPPGSRFVNEGYTPAAGEVVLADKDYRGKETWLWDGAAQALRQPTAADFLRFAKRRKKAEFEGAAEIQMRDILPPYRLTMLVARDLRADPRLTEATQLDLKLERALTQIETKTTAANVDAMKWEDQR